MTEKKMERQSQRCRGENGEGEQADAGSGCSASNFHSRIAPGSDG